MQAADKALRRRVQEDRGHAALYSGQGRYAIVVPFRGQWLV